MTEILPSIVDEGRRLLDRARAQQTVLALLGGVAVRVRAGDVPPALDREYKDLDFAVLKGGGADAGRLLGESGYEPDSSFNAMNGHERLLFYDTANGRQVDVFVGEFRMCHVISFADRLVAGQATVPLSELLLTKLQIVELNEKDVRDTLLLLYGHDVAGDDDHDIDGGHVAQLCAADWGLWRTITANLARCSELIGEYELADDARGRIATRFQALLERIEAEPKSRGWKLRARIGERKRWYELPEEVG